MQLVIIHYKFRVHRNRIYSTEHFTAAFKNKSIVCNLIDNRRTKEIAKRFLEQYNAPVTVNSAYLEGTVWIVIAKTGLINKQTRRVFIDSTSARVLSCNSQKPIR